MSDCLIEVVVKAGLTLDIKTEMLNVKVEAFRNYASLSAKLLQQL